VGVDTFRTGNGADWLDFLATRLGRYRAEQVELLSGPRQMRAWLREHGMEPSGPVTAADLPAAHALRECLHRLAVAAVAGHPPHSADIHALREALSADTPLRVRRTDTGLQLVRPANTKEALARLARQAAENLAGPTRDRLHACGDDTCSGIFIDHTGRRRWCSDERCGVRARVRAHRARAREHG
jgi:predicted RNA-binding Zn ribbon-like protein